MKQNEAIKRIYENKEFPHQIAIEFCIDDIFLLNETGETYIIRFTDKSSNSYVNPPKIEWFLHKKFYPIFELKTKRDFSPIQIGIGGHVRLIGCKLYQTSLHVMNQFRVLPSDNAIFVLNDIDTFADFPDIHTNLFNDDIVSFKGRVSKNITISEANQKYMASIHLGDRYGQNTVRLCFKNENAVLKNAIYTGDWVLVWKGRKVPVPYSAIPHVEYSTKTVLFLIPYDIIRDSQRTVSQELTPTPPEPKDMSTFPERQRYHLLGPNMTNISLIGRVIKRMNNTPDQGRTRLEILLAELDSEEIVKIIFWDSNGHSTVDIFDGHIIFIKGLSTTPLTTDGQFFINCHEGTHSSIVRISGMPGILTSIKDLFRVTRIQDIISLKLKNAILCCRIVFCTIKKPSSAYKVHKVCKRPVENMYCKFCSSSIEVDQDLCTSYDLIWKLQEAHHQKIECHARYNVNKRLLQCTDESKSLSPKEILPRVMGIVNKALEYMVDITIISYSPPFGIIEHLDERINKPY